jgi:hypothetical protein
VDRGTERLVGEAVSDPHPIHTVLL